METDSLDLHKGGGGNKLEGLRHYKNRIEGGWTLEKVTQRRCGVSILGDIQKFIERVLEKFDIIRP